MTDNWNKKTEKDVKQLLPEINNMIDPVPFDIEQTIIRSQPLTFYEGYELLELTDMSTIPAAKKYVVYKPGDVNVVDWTNDFIYELNKNAPINLTENNVTSYIKFFLEYVQGRHGKFTVIETEYDIKWQVEPPAQGRKIMQEMLKPIEILKKESDGSFDLKAFVTYKDSLFTTNIKVNIQGIVEISQEEVKIEGMPLLQDSSL